MFTKEYCVELLQRHYRENGTYPKKADYSIEEMSAIKSHLGPWPRALEAAGIKEPKPVTKADRRKEKRIQVKRARNAQRKQYKKEQRNRGGDISKDTTSDGVNEKKECPIHEK